MDNRSMVAPAKATISAKHIHNIMEPTAALTQVTTHTHRILRIQTLKKITRRNLVEREAMMMEMILLLHQRI